MSLIHTHAFSKILNNTKEWSKYLPIICLCQSHSKPILIESFCMTCLYSETQLYLYIFLFWCLFKYYFLAFRQCYIPPIQGKYIIWQICLHIFYIYCWELWIHVSHQFLWRNLAKCIRNLSFLSQPTSLLKIIFRWFLGFSRHIIMVVNSLQPQVCPRFIPQLPRW